jgi:hypothetical protein
MISFLGCWLMKQKLFAWLGLHTLHEREEFLKFWRQPVLPGGFQSLEVGELGNC